ncbi:MAG: V-type ATP synthase subunit F [Candidatus Methanosuratincola verstraetei]|jgi:vacuolar-type H+-ATPase subunit F/Vma7|uniref:V-type ATP synthase subunit F n=1 Tax=Methanosuratincola subterraneus TaxID=2593994 RepID=A0A444L5T7_METS7|nr:MAG: V-type ATP synthase subunit F [Candidatus Methanosuratincola subterraneus]
MKIFFVGSPQLAEGYKIAGVHPIAVTSDDEFLRALEGLLSNEEAGIVLMDGDYVSAVGEKIERLKTRSKLPVYLEVPGKKSGTTVDLKSMISRIMGVKV